jgi:hypothetical protein
MAELLAFGTMTSDEQSAWIADRQQASALARAAACRDRGHVFASGESRCPRCGTRYDAIEAAEGGSPADQAELPPG